MDRRKFATSLGAATLAAQPPGSIRVGVLTQADGPHLGAYLAGLAAAKEASSISLCDASGTTQQAARQVLGTRLAAVYRDHRELLAREKPALALVSMEAKLSPPVIEAALEAGCHVMAEKPACVRIEDFEPLAKKADAKGRQLMLALANRVDPLVLEMKRRIGAGAFGKIYGMDLHIIADQTRLTRPEYHKTWTAQRARAGGGHLIWLGIHWLDLAMYVTGSNITDVMAFTGNVGGQPIDIEDSAAAAVRFDNGTFGTITSGYYVDKGYHSQIKIWGSHGWIEMRKHGSPRPLVWYSTKEPRPVEHEYKGPAEPSGYTPWVQECVRFAAGSGPAPLTTAGSLRVLRVVFGCYKSADTGRRVSIA